MSRKLIVRSPGALSLVQDSGRSGFQRYGVSVSGAIDPEALLAGNLLVGNDLNAAAIEVTFGGAEFMFDADAVVAVTGGDLQPALDGTPLPLWESFFVHAGSTLTLAAPVAGLRAYVAIDGGVDTPPVLGSRSTHVSSKLGGLTGEPLKAGDEVPLGAGNPDAKSGARLPTDLRTEPASEVTVRVIAGPQQDVFTTEGIKTFFSSVYTVTESSDRQGLRLDGPQIEALDGRYDIVSDAVVCGAIQVPGDRKPIILLADRQTTGGYAKIGVVATVDLPLLAQAAPGATVRFSSIDVAEAQRLLRERRESMLSAQLTAGLTSTDAAISTADGSDEVKLRYRRSDLTEPGGGLVTATVRGMMTTVRVEEIE